MSPNVALDPPIKDISRSVFRPPTYCVYTAPLRCGQTKRELAVASRLLEHGHTNSYAELAFSVELCAQEVQHPSSPTVCRQLRALRGESSGDSCALFSKINLSYHCSGQLRNLSRSSGQFEAASCMFGHLLCNTIKIKRSYS